MPSGFCRNTELRWRRLRPTGNFSMPIYEYKCQQCGNQIEKRQSVSEAPLTTCEKCHGKLEKQWSLSGFQFKGAGWYVTDYAAKKGGGNESTTGDETASKPSGDKISTSIESSKEGAKESSKETAKESVSTPAVSTPTKE